jgi:hypothetical protein
MKEEHCRLIKVILSAIFVGGVLVIGHRISDSVRLMADNGRYVQFDQQKNCIVYGSTIREMSTQMLDTRTGIVQPPPAAR